MKKKIKVIFIALICAVAIMLLSFLGIITVKGLGISEGRYLEAKNGVSMIILDNSPIQMSNRTGKNLFDKLDTGDKILVLHDGIAESYPGRTGVYAVFKQEDGTIDDIPQAVISNLTEMGWLDKSEASGTTLTKEELDTTVSYANWTDAQEIYFGALNTDKLAISSVKHLPIYKFDTLEDLEQFKLTFSEVLTMDHGYNEVPSFHDVTTKYDEAFFEENTLLLVYIATNSGSLRFDLDSVYCDDASLCIHVKQINNPEVVTEDMAGWFITIAVADDMVAGCAEFDAAFNNDFNANGAGVELLTLISSTLNENLNSTTVMQLLFNFLQNTTYFSECVYCIFKILFFIRIK